MENRINKQILFMDSNVTTSSECKNFANNQELADYLQDEMTNYGRKEIGMYDAPSWEALIERRINFDKLLG